MLRFIVLVLLPVVANVVVGDDLESDEFNCEPRYWTSGPEFPCYGHLSTGFKCNNSFLSISDTPFYDCSNVSLFWNYPMYNWIVNIEAANYTNLKQPFAVTLSNTFGLPAYRIYPNGQEVLISSTTAEQVVQTSDENYQVVLKIQG
ncbi:unnamed protein product, partial [Rotaria sp. Silwood2]